MWAGGSVIRGEARGGGSAPKGGGGASEASQQGRGQSLPTGRPGAREVVHGFGTAPYPLSFHSGGQSFEHLDGARVVGHPHLAGRCVVGDPDRPEVGGVLRN